MTMRPYFAYGSNLNARDWKSRTAPNSGLVPQERANLPDHKLVFNIFAHGREGGVLNVAPSVGHVVEGYLFDLANDAAEALRRKEGSNYELRAVIVLGDDGREIEAFTYVGHADAVQGFVPPHPSYLEVCREGRRDLGCCTAMLEDAARGLEPAHVDGLFAYGTLMRHEERFGCLKPFQPHCIILAETRGALLSHGAYPGLVLEGSAPVAGEFIRVSSVEQAFQALDAIEGFNGFGATGNLFRRTLIDVDVGEGRVRRAWVYVTTRSGESIPSGCWRTHRDCMKPFRRAMVAAHAEGYPDFAEAVWSWSRRFAEETSAPSHYHLRALEDEVALGRISERRLAMTSGRWSLVPGVPAADLH
ncbi:MAG: gamma-glutamylcyclotransferase [Burkholderiales bacterium]|nr:gamma-glutamylcyclotransferase [Burkholderiales bacterium]